jgi:hypothetical protein
MELLLRLLLLACVVTASACGEACDLVLKAGIVVNLIDGATGNPLPGDATVTATEGSYTETVNPPAPPAPTAGSRIVFLANERPGTYRVEVQAPGYVTWIATNVRVTHDGCHVETVQLTAELQPAGTD